MHEQFSYMNCSFKCALQYIILASSLKRFVRSPIFSAMCIWAEFDVQDTLSNRINKGLLEQEQTAVRSEASIQGMLLDNRTFVT